MKVFNLEVSNVEEVLTIPNIPKVIDIWIDDNGQFSLCTHAISVIMKPLFAHVRSQIVDYFLGTEYTDGCVYLKKDVIVDKQSIESDPDLYNLVFYRKTLESGCDARSAKAVIEFLNKHYAEVRTN